MRPVGRGSRLASALVALILGWTSGAAAQSETASAPADPDALTDSARALFNEGTGWARRGEWSRALTAFEQSDSARANAVTTYNVGYCERALGRYMLARKTFGSALAENAAHGGVELPEVLASAAKRFLAELERQIARPVVTLSQEGVSVLVDGRPLERAAADGPRPVLWAGTRAMGAAEPVPASTFELQIDPGVHVLVLSKPGFAEAAITGSYEPGSEATLTFELKPEAAPGAAPAAGASPPPASTPSSPRPVTFYVSLGVGAAGLATALAASAVALDLKGEGPSHYAAAGTAADVATVSVVAGGVGAAGALLLWLLSSRKPPSKNAVAAPVLSAGLFGIRATF